MIGIDQALLDRQKSGQTIGLGLVGAGQMGTDIVAQVGQMTGLEIRAVCDILPERGVEAFRIRGVPDTSVARVCDLAEAEAECNGGRFVVTDRPEVAVGISKVDVVIEATGNPFVGVGVALSAMRARKHVVMMNVETDVTVGPMLRQFAEAQGVVYTLGAGDEPVALKELYDFARALGLRVVAGGKGKNNRLNRSAVPDDVADEARSRGLSPAMLVEFIDGSKTMIEMAAFGNATGLTPDRRGMHGPSTTRSDLARVFALATAGGILSREGVVDYAIGDVAPGVFLVVTTDHPRIRQAMKLRDMGDGPNYLLFRPFHLCSMEVPLSAAVAAISGKSSMAPLDDLVCEVFPVAKKRLEVGEELDGIGGAHYFGSIESAKIARKEGLLPLGLARGGKVTRTIEEGQPINYESVALPNTILLRVRRLQDDASTGRISRAEAVSKLDAVLAPG